MVEGPKSRLGGGNIRRQDFLRQREKEIFGISEENPKAQYKGVSIRMWRHTLSVNKKEEFKGYEKGKKEKSWSTEGDKAGENRVKK